MKNGKRFTQISILIILVMCVIIGVYYVLTRRPKEMTEESSVPASTVQELLSVNFERNYPPSPKEVLKQYSEITKAFYNETYTDEELEALAFKIQELYDDELIANETEEQYIRTLKSDISNFKNNNIVISSYATSASTDVDYFAEDGFQWARLNCVYTIRQGTQMGAIREVFILRKDDNGHWKIYGWDKLKDEKEQGITAS